MKVPANALDSAADLLLGWRCPGCGRPAFHLCESCRAALTVTTVRRAHRTLAGYPVTWAAGGYDQLHRQLISAYKDRSALFLAKPLAVQLAAAVSAVMPLAEDDLVLVPVPSSSAANRRRGVDATELLARRTASYLRARGSPVKVRPLLCHSRRVADQSGLDRVQRSRNLNQSMRATATAAAAVVIVDDVTTTGATLVEAARALHAEGNRVQGAAVVAATELRGRSSAGNH